MEKNMQFLRFHEPENAGQEAISLIQQYNSVLMVYKRSGPEYKNAVLETEDLFYRLKVLDRELKKGTYKGHLPRFKKDWAVLYAELMKNQEETREVTMHLSQIEPMYLRISPRIEEWVSKAQK